MKFMVSRNPVRLLACLLAAPFVLPFLPCNKTKFIGFSIWLWLLTVGMPPRKIVHLRNSFIERYLKSETTLVFKKALEHLLSHTQKNDRIIVVSGASKWMVKKVLSQFPIPQIELVCSEEIRIASGMVSRFHCYSHNKVKHIQQLLDLKNYESIIGYSDSSVDIPILTLCTQRIVVNPKQKCLRKFSKSFNHSMTVVNWT